MRNLLVIVVVWSVSAVAAADEPQTASVLVAKNTKEAAPAEQEHMLRYKFTEGEVIRWRVTHLGNTETTIQGNTQTSKHRSVSTKLWRVTKVDEQG
ncbi:MAG: hypothetical protein AB7F89_08120, partial [Pirellulaceae bacterium]